MKDGGAAAFSGEAQPSPCTFGMNLQTDRNTCPLEVDRESI
jgi:hypothetical protein